jgi:tRNA dimethylallyltransferase
MEKLLVVIGPTGTGKTNLALELAKKFNGELVSADSRQIYAGMDVGTGKEIQNSKLEIQKEQNKWVVGGIPIHLYDVITPDKTFSVAQYQQLAYEAISEIHKKNKLPILVGGTGLYIRAVVEGLKIPKAAPNKKLRADLEPLPMQILNQKLEKIDPELAEKIDKDNRRRIVRALEVYHQTGQPLSKLKGKYKVKYDALKIGLSATRSYLYARADFRVDEWLSKGFIDEVKKLLKVGYKNTTALTSLGYRQITMFLQDQISLEEARRRIKFEHHAYIRRQITWFRKETGVFWYDIAESNYKNDVYEKVNEWLQTKPA